MKKITHEQKGSHEFTPNYILLYIISQGHTQSTRAALPSENNEDKKTPPACASAAACASSGSQSPLRWPAHEQTSKKPLTYHSLTKRIRPNTGPGRASGAGWGFQNPSPIFHLVSTFGLVRSCCWSVHGRVLLGRIIKELC